jgi:hypothetical protein
MTLPRSDLDQSARYLRYACELPEQEALAKTKTLRELRELAARRLTPRSSAIARGGSTTDRSVRPWGLNYWQTEAFLKERSVPLNYSVADLRD